MMKERIRDAVLDAAEAVLRERLFMVKFSYFDLFCMGVILVNLGGLLWVL